MPYPALVVENDPAGEEIPCKGCIKVVCPDLLGYKITPFPVQDEGKLLIEKLRVSQWVVPSYSHPMDFYIPAKGEGVWVEPIGGNINRLVYTGFFPGKDFANLILMEQGWKGINTMYSEETDRIIGTRNGSYIKIEDKIDGKIIIEVIGNTNRGQGDSDGAERFGCQIILDSTTDAENIQLITHQKEEGKVKQIIKLDSTLDAEKISISSLGADEKGLKEIILDQENDLITIQGKSLDDKASQIFLMDFANALFSFEGKDADDSNPQTLLIDLANKISSLTNGDTLWELDNDGKKITIDDGANKIVTDKQGKVVDIKAGDQTEIKMDGTANKIKITNGTFNLKGVLGDFIDIVKGMTTMGSPTTHTVLASDQAQLAALKSAKVNNLLDG